MAFSSDEQLFVQNSTMDETNFTASNTSLNGTLSFTGQSNSAIELYLSISGIVALILLMLVSGCRVKHQDLVYHLKRPWCLLVGMGCQYIVLPLVAFCVTLAFSVQPNQAVAIIITCTCPGGPLSNLGTIAVDGDVSLRYVINFKEW